MKYFFLILAFAVNANIIAQTDITYKKLSNGNDYFIGIGSIVADTNVVTTGKIIQVYVTSKIVRPNVADTIIFNSYQTGKIETLSIDSNTLYIQNQQTQKQEVSDIYAMLGTKAGDSVTIKSSLANIIKKNPSANGFGTNGDFILVLKTTKIFNNQQDYTNYITAENDAKKIINAKLFKNYITKNKLATNFKPKEGIYVTITKKGTTPILNGNFVKVRYKGTLINGTIFDSNIGGVKIPGRPLTNTKSIPTLDFVVGAKEMIAGFDEAMKYFTKGSKGTIVLPYNKAYGASGNGQIGAYETLVFDVEIVAVLPNKQKPITIIKTKPNPPHGQPGHKH